MCPTSFGFGGVDSLVFLKKNIGKAASKSILILQIIDDQMISSYNGFSVCDIQITLIYIYIIHELMYQRAVLYVV